MNNEVLIIATEFPPGPGGIGSHAYSMAKALHSKGIDVTVVACGDYVAQDRIDRFDNAQPFNIIRYPQGRFGLKYLKRFGVAAKNRKKNIILSGKFSLWIGLWLKLISPKTHTISVLHGSEINLSNALLKKITHLSISSSDEIVAVSNFTKRLLPSRILKTRNVTIIPNGIDLSNFHSSSNSIVLEGNPAILTVGNVTPRKGQHRVIKALPAILQKFPNAHYHIVGLPTYKDKFSELARSIGVENAVTFHGRAKTFEDLFAYYKAADVFAILSENQKNGDCEGFGIVILEAGYFNLPAIGAKGCGIEDAIVNGHNGYLVDGDNAQEICNSIENLLTNSAALQLGAKDWAEKHDWNTIIEDIIKLMK